MKSKTFGKELKTEKKYSEEDIVLRAEKFFKPSMCGDCFSSSPWGEEENKRLYLFLFDILDIGKKEHIKALT